MMRTETTVFRARFVFRDIPSGFRLTMTPLSFRYLVNDRVVSSPVWDLIRGKNLVLEFNVVGKLTESRGYDQIDKELAKSVPVASAAAASLHLDRQPIGEEERESWDRRILLWLNQPAAPGTKVEFDSMERGFTGERVPSHTTMKVLRAQACGSRRCVKTSYTMVPDLDAVRRHANETVNHDFIDLSASEQLEQIIEPTTMLPHYQRLTWKSNVSSMTPDGELSRGASLVAVSEFVYGKQRR